MNVIHQLSILFVVFNLRPFKIIIDLETFPNHAFSVSVRINFESRKFPFYFKQMLSDFVIQF